MNGRERPDLIDRLKASLALGDDDVSAEMLRRLKASALRMKLIPPSRVAPVLAAAPMVLRGVVVTEPRVYEKRRLRRALDRLAFASNLLVWSFSFLSSIATLLVFLLMLFFISALMEKPPDDLTLVVGLGGELNGVQVTPEKGKEDKTKDAEKGPDQKEDPEKTPTVDEKSDKVEEKNKVDQVDQTPQQGVVNSDERKSVVTEAKTFSSTELESIITSSLDSIGQGPAAPLPRPSARDLGRLISENPTKAVEKTHGGTIAALRKGKAKQIVVVGGEYDECERVMEALAIPHTLVQAERFIAFDLSDSLLVIINCDGRYSRSRIREDDKDWAKFTELGESRTQTQQSIERLGDGDAKRRDDLKKHLADIDKQIDELRKKLEKRPASPIAKKVREFVKGGGYLMTTDWALTVTEAAFPGYVYYASRYGPHRTMIKTNDKNREHPLLKDALVDVEQGTRATGGQPISWYVDAGSYLFDFDESRVTELIRGTTLPTFKSLVVTFKPFTGTKEQEGGRVLHVLGHFKEQGDAFGDFVLQSLFLNLVKERMKLGD